MYPDIPNLDPHRTPPPGIFDRRSNLFDGSCLTVRSDHSERVIENVEPFEFVTFRGADEPPFEERVKLAHFGFERRPLDHCSSTS